MDVVKRVIESMNGHIDVESMRGRGHKVYVESAAHTFDCDGADGPVRQGALWDSLAERARSDDADRPRSLQQMGERAMMHIGDEAIDVQPLGAI